MCKRKENNLFDVSINYKRGLTSEILNDNCTSPFKSLLAEAGSRPSHAELKKNSRRRRRCVFLKLSRLEISNFRVPHLQLLLRGHKCIKKIVSFSRIYCSAAFYLINLIKLRIVLLYLKL